MDVAKGIRMFARMAVPCVAVAENMSFFDTDDGKRCAAHAAPLTYICEREAGLHGCSSGPMKESGPLQHGSAYLESFQELHLRLFVCHGSLCALAEQAPRQ